MISVGETRCVMCEWITKYNTQRDLTLLSVALPVSQPACGDGRHDYIHNPSVDICAKWRPYVTIGDDTPTINGLPTPSRGGGK